MQRFIATASCFLPCYTAFTSTILVSDFASLTTSVRSVALQIRPNIEDVNRFDLSTFHVRFWTGPVFALQSHYFFPV